MGKIPVNIVTGSLGVGKTTAIIKLLEQKPEGSCPFAAACPLRPE